MSLIQINVLKGQQLKSQKRKNMMKNKILIPFKYLTMIVMALSLTLLTFCSDDDDIDKDDPERVMLKIQPLLLIQLLQLLSIHYQEILWKVCGNWPQSQEP